MKNKIYIMEIKEEQALRLVKDYLKEIGYSEKVEIKRYLVKNILKYEIYNYINYHGKETRILSELDCDNYMGLLRKVFEKEDNEVYKIYPVIKNDRISYNISYSYINQKTYRK